MIKLANQPNTIHYGQRDRLQIFLKNFIGIDIETSALFV